jgi:glycosyltransferase involved in cell wall biosynthesis
MKNKLLSGLSHGNNNYPRMKIAYLAPEIPALSATFVYNEMLYLEKLGVTVAPFSVHPSTSVFDDEAILELQKKVTALYGLPIYSVIKDNLVLSLTKPINYIKTLKWLIADLHRVGFFSRTGMGLCYRFLFGAKLARQLIKSDCQHIHVHFAHVPGDLAMYAASFANISFSVTAHANDLFERAWLLPEKVGRSAFFATISDFNKSFLVKLGANAGKIVIVRCGVDVSQFKQRINFQSGDCFKIGVVARLIEKKGIDTLIRSCAELKSRGDKVVLHIAGSGPLSDELVKLAEAIGLSADEVVLLGAIPHKQVAKFINTLDVFVLPCKQDAAGDMDGIPVVLMEAMLSGVPVISTRLSGIPELVVDKQTGLLVDPDSPEQLADAIVTLKNDEVLKSQLIAKASDKVKQNFSLPKNVTELFGLFAHNLS